ncbi:MAG: 2-succinyl-5-enolpyruvyl-6-hydroxy-3-cyclohexene-1-carboxylic-acid synthase [Phycisphaerales bacterium]|nr:2-succinyl-5-enolpyruvyl-6-hydroxy-3-cyclohexene-1-carboxylic-acid synthase [Phycisphaerales bacterium]
MARDGAQVARVRTAFEAVVKELRAAANFNLAWTMLIAEECARLGVQHAIICPGSRSAPLAVAFARNTEIQTHIAHDERGGAFLALGIAKATGVPAVLIVTSGTAVANTLPALVEARMSRTPMLVLSADRPPELLDCGANQAITHAPLLAGAARWSVSMPCPTPEIPAEYVLSTMDEAFARACGDAGSQGGGVHVNCAFREPLAPEVLAWDSAWLDSIARWTKDRKRTAWRVAIGAIETEVEVGAAVLIVGRSPNAVTQSLATWRGTLLADITSGLAQSSTIGADLVLRACTAGEGNAALQAALRVEGIVCAGDAILSKRLTTWVSQQDCPIEVFGAGDPRIDPMHRVTTVHAAPVVFRQGRALKPHAGWKRALACANRAAMKALSSERALCEPTAITEVRDACAAVARGTMFYGSSMPIRDAEFLAIAPPRNWSVGSNRGASGIDGLLATAVGHALATAEPVVAFVGDVSTLHDLNSLQLASNVESPLVFVVLNNDGGSIFRYLPIAKHTDVFERCFSTPHGRTFAHFAQAFGIAHATPATRKALASSMTKALKRGGATLIEVSCTSAESERVRAQVSLAAQQALRLEFK